MNKYTVIHYGPHRMVFCSYVEGETIEDALIKKEIDINQCLYIFNGHCEHSSY